MKKCLFAVLMLLGMVGCETNHATNSGNVTEQPKDESVSPLDVDGFVITLPAWEQTRAYSRLDLTTPDLAIGEKVAVVDESGTIHEFFVKEKIGEDGTAVDGANDDKDGKKNNGNVNKSFVIESPNVELVVGESYRVQYPFPEVGDGRGLSLGFGGYEDTPTLDWFVSKWHKYTKEGKLHFNLKRINSVLIFDVVAPFSGQVEEIRLGSEKAIFCIKGVFDVFQDDLKPIATTWTNQYKFPHKDMTWVEGETYTLMLTVWPYDYSAEEYTLDIYTVDNGVAATTKISIPKLKEGKIEECRLSKFEILPAPVYEKDAIEEAREGDKVCATWNHNGEFY